MSAHSREGDGRTHTNLKQLLSSAGPVPVAQAASLMLRVCEALAEMHASGTVHGNLSPSRIAITTTDDGSLDLEVHVEPGGFTHPALDDDDVWPYLAPEQLRGEGRVTARADLWAVGAILHEMLSGVRPFSAAMAGELAAAIESQHPTPVSKLRRDVAPGMDTLILYCLEKSPDGRPPSVGHVASALGRFVPQDARGAVARIHAILRQQRPSDPRTDLAMVASGPAHDRSSPTVAPVGGSIFAASSAVWAQRAKLGAGGVAFVVVCGLVGHSLRRETPAPSATATSVSAPAVAKPNTTSATAESEDAIQVLRADELPAMHVVDISALPSKPQRSAVSAPAAPRPVEAAKAGEAAAAEPSTPPGTPSSNIVPEAVELAEDEAPNDGTTFNAAAAKASIASAAARASACHDGTSPPEKSVVTITFAPTGEASNVTANGALAGTPTGACVEQLFRGVSVPPFTGDSVTVSRTVSVGN